MTKDKYFDLAKSRVENFGQWLNEASSYMLDFTTNEDFEQINPDIQMKLNRVSESLLDFWSMWHDGQIIVKNKERTK